MNEAQREVASDNHEVEILLNADLYAEFAADEFPGDQQWGDQGPHTPSDGHANILEASK